MSVAFKQGGFSFAIDDSYHDDLSDHSYELVSFTGKNPKGAPILKPLIKAKQEAVWVLGRLISLYGIEPTDESERGDESMMECSLCAWADGDSADDSVPFFISDDRGHTNISFGEATGKRLSKKIAQAFAQLMMKDPEEIEDYTQTIGSDASTGLRFGVRSAAPFCVDASEDVDEFGMGDPFSGGSSKPGGDDDLFGLADDDEFGDDDEDDDLFGGGDEDEDEEDDDRGGLDWGQDSDWN